MEKKEIRKQVFKCRKELIQSDLDLKSQIICEKIMELEAFRKAKTIYTYMDCKGEVSTKLLMETAWSMLSSI